MSRDAAAGLVGAVFGLVFVLVNAGDLEGPWDLLVRGAGIACIAAVTLLLFRSDAPALPTVAPQAWKVYRIAVVAEVVALFAGAQVLNRTGHAGLSLPWVVVVVGVHFFPLAWAFQAPFFHVLAGTLVALGVLGGALGLAGADRAVVSLVSGVGAGFALLAFAARPTLKTRRSAPT
ncbi:MAG: hypothetical protein ABIR34_10620 [Marmoricola sp.]